MSATHMIEIPRLPLKKQKEAMRPIGPPPFEQVAIFPDRFEMSPFIETVTAEAVTNRIQRMLSRDPTPWNGQMIQEEVDEFFQCKAFFLTAPYEMYFCWSILEWLYTRRKLRAYIAHIKPLCKHYNIAVYTRKGDFTFRVPWSTENDSKNLRGMYSVDKLAHITTRTYRKPPASLVIPPAVSQQIIDQAVPLLQDIRREHFPDAQQ
mgnify:CR=1 FL=1